MKRLLQFTAVLTGFILFFLSVSVAFYVIVLPVLTRHAEESLVPDVTGMDVNLAVSMLTKSDLGNAVHMKPFKEGLDEGYVLAQVPPPGKSVKKGRTILLEVSLGTPLVEIPEVKGRSFGQITRQLAERGLNIEESVRIFSDDYPKGTAIASNPEAGAGIREGYPVRLLVSKGEAADRLIMPNMRNRSAGYVKAGLDSLGFEVELIPLHLPRNWRNIPVQRQEPAPGAVISKTDKIIIYLEENKT